MNIEILSKSYSVRRLNQRDVDSIYALCRENTVFYQYHPPFVTRDSILKDMTALPPEKSMEDKYYLGFFAGDELVAVMDLILNYPKADIAFIGFFMMNAQYQGRGIGSQIVDEVTAHLKACGFNEIRLGVDKGNPQSRAFWTKNGFSPVDEKDYILMSRIDTARGE